MAQKLLMIVFISLYLLAAGATVEFSLAVFLLSTDALPTGDDVDKKVLASLAVILIAVSALHLHELSTRLTFISIVHIVCALHRHTHDASLEIYAHPELYSRKEPTAHYMCMDDPLYYCTLECNYRSGARYSHERSRVW